MTTNQTIDGVPRRAVEWAFERLEICQDQAFQSCECEECEQCGKMPDECSGTDCAKTCQCSTCDHCSNALAMTELRALLDAPATWLCDTCKVEQPTDRVCDVCGAQTKPAAQPQGEPTPITGDMDRLMEAYRLGEFSSEGGSETVEALSVEAFDAVESHGHDADSYMSGYCAALYEQAKPFILLALKPQVEQPAPVAVVAVVLPEQLNPAELDELEVIEALLSGQGLSNLAGTMAAARQFIDEVTRLNAKSR